MFYCGLSLACRSKAEKLELFKTQLAAAVPALAASSHSKLQVSHFYYQYNYTAVHRIIFIHSDRLKNWLMPVKKEI